MSDKEIVRGAEADRILKHEILVEAFDTVREGIVRAMTNSAMGDTNTHNRLVIALQLLSQIEKHFVVGTIGFVACDAILTNYLEHSKWTCAGLGLLAMIAKEKTDNKFSTPDIAAGMAGVGLGAAIRFNF